MLSDDVMEVVDEAQEAGKDTDMDLLPPNSAPLATSSAED